MSTEKKADKVLPGGIGCQGCGCLMIIIAVVSAFIAGVVYHEETKEKLDELQERLSGDVAEQVDNIKEKVQ